MSEIRDLWLQTKVNIYCALVVATLYGYKTWRVYICIYIVSASSIQAIFSALLSLLCCHKTAGLSTALLNCCHVVNTGARLQDVQLCQTQFSYWTTDCPRPVSMGRSYGLKCREKLRGSIMRQLMGKFKANPQLCAISVGNYM